MHQGKRRGRPNGLSMQDSRPLPRVHLWVQSRPAAWIRRGVQRAALKPLVWRLVRVTVTGSAPVRELAGPVVVVANHSSHLDTPLIVCSLPRALGRDLAVGAAADYFFDATWRAVLTGLAFNAFPVERGTARRLRGLAGRMLDNGSSLLVFPEGTRSRTGLMAAFKPGAAALSSTRDVPCLPIGLMGSFAAMPRGRNWPRRGRPCVTVNIGEPMLACPGETVESFNLRVSATVAQLSEQPAPPLAEPT